MTDLHAAIGRVQLDEGPRLDRAAPAERRVPRRAPPGRRHAPGRRRRPHVYHQYTIRVAGGPRRLATALREEYGIGTGVYYPIPNHRLPSFNRTWTCRRPSGRPSEVLSLPVHPSLTPGRPGAHRRPRSTRRPGRRLMAQPARRAHRPGHDGPPPRPRAPRARGRRPGRASPTPAATRTASPAQLPVLSRVDELIAAGIDMRSGGRAHRRCTRRSDSRWPTPASTRWSRSRSRQTSRPGSGSSRPSKPRAWSARVGHIERFNPALQSLRARIEAGELGEVYQIATRRQGPFPARIADVGVVKDLGHPRHRPDRLGGAEPLRVDLRPHRHPQRPPARGHGGRGGQLGNGVMTNHLVNWLSPMKERSRSSPVKGAAFVADTITADLTFFANGTVATEWESHGRVPRRLRGRRHPARDRQARAAAGRARSVPRRRPRTATATSSRCARAWIPSAWPKPCWSPPPTGRS